MMGWRPVTTCPLCGEPQDVYSLDLCAGCADWTASDPALASRRDSLPVEASQDLGQGFPSASPADAILGPFPGLTEGAP